MKKTRRTSREIALQALYALEVGGTPVAETICYLCRDKNIAEDTQAFALQIASDAAKHRKKLDTLIEDQATNWKLARVAVIDKNILRLAIAEMLYFDDIPVKVSIDEAIELAKKFSTQKSGKFVNGILDPIAKQKIKRL